MSRHASFKAVVVAALSGLLLAGCASTEFVPAGENPASGLRECVVLLHGLARTSRSMRGLQAALAAEGYAVLNIDYPSTRHRVQTLSDKHIKPAVERHCGTGYDRIHFVTHSLGGIIVRYYIENHEPADLGRVVMLSPPNRGSELADAFHDWFLFRWVNGPAGLQLQTGTDGLPARLGPVDFDLAVITGNRTLNPLYSMIIPGDDDGKVAVRSAKVDGMSAFEVVPHTHTFIMQADEVIRGVLRYLRDGRLKKR
jgi:pimeloyl-ACP methyl ester carboxylesterase